MMNGAVLNRPLHILVRQEQAPALRCDVFIRQEQACGVRKNKRKKNIE